MRPVLNCLKNLWHFLKFWRLCFSSFPSGFFLSPYPIWKLCKNAQAMCSACCFLYSSLMLHSCNKKGILGLCVLQAVLFSVSFQRSLNGILNLSLVSLLNLTYILETESVNWTLAGCLPGNLNGGEHANIWYWLGDFTYLHIIYTHIVLIFRYDELHEYNLEGTCWWSSASIQKGEYWCVLPSCKGKNLTGIYLQFFQA